MAVQFKRKACATCEYWSGAREALSSKDGSRCDKSTIEGVCGNPKSSFKKKNTKCDYGSCTKYEAWSVLSKLKK